MVLKSLLLGLAGPLLPAKNWLKKHLLNRFMPLLMVMV